MKSITKLLIVAAAFALPLAAGGQQYYPGPSPSEVTRSLNQAVPPGAFQNQHNDMAAHMAEQQRIAHQIEMQQQTQQQTQQQMWEKDAEQRKEAGKSGLWFWGLLFGGGVVLVWSKRSNGWA